MTNCTVTQELIQTTREAFQQYGSQTEAATALGVSRQYVWKALNDETFDNDEFMLKLADYITKVIEENKAQKKAKTTRLKSVLAL